MPSLTRACLAPLVAAIVGLSFVEAAEPQAPLRRIAFGSCAHQERAQPIWEAVVAAKPELFLFIGDNIYGDTRDMDVLRAKYAKLAAVPGYQKLLKTCPVLATWDDHDYGVNDGGADYPKRRESQQIFLDFFGVAKDSPRRGQDGVYSAAVFGPSGKQVQVILLDTRFFRSPLKKKEKVVRGEGPYVPNPDPAGTFLGEAQWKWLGQQLRAPAQVRLIASSIQVVAEDHSWEKWMNIPHERERLFQLLRETKAGGVVFLSGDRHLAELSVMDGGVGYPIYDLTSSGLNQAFKGWRRLEPNRHRVATMGFGNNFGLVTIDWDRPDPRLSLQVRDEEGDIIIQDKVALSTLQPGTVLRPAGPNLAEEAAKHLNKEFTLEMDVRATGASRDKGLIFLNSEADFKDARNFTVVLDMKAAGPGLKQAGIADPAKHFAGKRVRVTGVVSLHQERPQIIVKDAKQLQVIEK